MYLFKRREMRRRDVIVTVLACLCLLALGGAWLFTMNRRRRGILADIEAGLEQTRQPRQNHTGALR